MRMYVIALTAQVCTIPVLALRCINNAAPTFPSNFKHALENFDVNEDGMAALTCVHVIVCIHVCTVCMVATTHVCMYKCTYFAIFVINTLDCVRWPCQFSIP